MKNNFYKYILGIFIILIVVLVIYIMNRNQSNNQQQEVDNVIKSKEKVEQVLNLGIAELDTINPILSQNKYVQSISKLICEPLININENFKLESCIASEWAKTSETTYVIKIKEIVKWSNGEKCTAEDVLFTIEKIKQLAEASIYFNNVKNIEKSEFIDLHTIKITTNKEIPFFEYNLNFPIISKTYFTEEDSANSEKAPIGTGKYSISKIQDSQIILTKNEEYWKDEEPQIETIKITLYKSVGEMYNDFKLGKIDLANTTNVNIEEYIGTIGYNKVEGIGREYDYLVFNTQHNILSNQEVREAISYAIDKNAIISSIHKGKYTIADFPLPVTNWLYQGENENKYNSEKAKQILQENGWEFKFGYWQKYVNYYTRKLNLRLVVNSSNETRVAVAEIIKSQLEAIGIKVTIIKANDYNYQKYKTNKNYDMILCGAYIGTSPDLTRYFGDDNLANFKNEEVKTILNDLKNITDEDLLKQEYKRLHEIYTQEVPYISLYYSYEVTAYNKSLSGNIKANWYDIFQTINNWRKK